MTSPQIGIYKTAVISLPNGSNLGSIAALFLLEEDFTKKRRRIERTIRKRRKEKRRRRRRKRRKKNKKRKEGKQAIANIEYVALYNTKHLRRK